MKKYLLLLTFIVPMIFASCNKASRSERELTAHELDSITYSRINDSINNLDTIRILNSLFLGMTPIQFDSLKESATNEVEIDKIVFNNIEAIENNGEIRHILFKGKQELDYISNMDEMAQHIIDGEKSFNSVVKTLSSKYGKPKWIISMSPIDDRGHQHGHASWNFDELEVAYTQHHWAYPTQLSLTINAEISYSIPRKYTEKEIQMADSLIQIWKQQLVDKEEKNKRAKESL